MKILITGSNGLLGQKLVSFCLEKNIPFLATSNGPNRNTDCPDASYKSMDITDRERVFEIVEDYSPSHIIHTAAMTNVDACETDPECCENINVTGTVNLVDASEKCGAHFQLLSTDFVFDGLKGAYVEEDKVNPLSEYATSKVKAEDYVKKNSSDWSIVRTIIVYGNGNNLSRSNIVAWAKSALEKGDPLNIVDDQFRSPTFAEDLAAGCMAIAMRGLNGIFHISGPEIMSIYELVERIGKHFGYDTSIINKISSTTLNQPAKRPMKTGFDLSKAYELLDYKPHSLEESLRSMYGA